MKLENIGSNQNEVDINGARVLFSYSTPVAANVGGKWFRTERQWSRTTTKHINRWLDGREAETKPQEFFDNLTA